MGVGLGISLMTENGEKWEMPVSIHVHHGLMDGYHVEKFVEIFQALLNEYKNKGEFRMK